MVAELAKGRKASHRVLTEAQAAQEQLAQRQAEMVAATKVAEEAMGRQQKELAERRDSITVESEAPDLRTAEVEKREAEADKRDRGVTARGAALGETKARLALPKSATQTPLYPIGRPNRLNVRSQRCPLRVQAV